MVDGAGLDHFFPLSEDPNIKISTYPFHKSFLGISHKEPPTDSQKIRQAILVALDWEALMSGIGPKELWFLCPAIYYCNTPLETDIGADEWYSQNDIPRAKALLEQGGYAGETLFIMNPADYATIAPLGPVLKAQMGRHRHKHRDAGHGLVHPDLQDLRPGLEPVHVLVDPQRVRQSPSMT